MSCKNINKEYRELISSPFNSSNSPDGLECGIIYTLYSESFNLLEIGFAENNGVLDTKLFKKEFILLDKKTGKKKELKLLINTLNEFGIKFSGNLKLNYSNFLIKHLSALGWPVGCSLYKSRKIKKVLTFE